MNNQPTDSNQPMNNKSLLQFALIVFLAVCVVAAVYLLSKNNNPDNSVTNVNVGAPSETTGTAGNMTAPEGAATDAQAPASPGMSTGRTPGESGGSDAQSNPAGSMGGSSSSGSDSTGGGTGSGGSTGSGSGGAQ